MKIFISIGVAVLAIVVFGLALPGIIPGCTCGFPASKCHGCGELIGNALGDFSGTCLILGAMGFVLVLWIGIPLLVVGSIVRAVYRFFNKEKAD